MGILKTLYLSHPDFRSELKKEITLNNELRLLNQWEDYFLVEGPVRSLVWAQDTGINVRSFSFQSIKEASQILKAEKKLFWQQSPQFFRRAELIQQNLGPLKKRTLKYSESFPNKPLSFWLLESETSLLVAEKSLFPLPYGQVQFDEDKSAPSRAYLKLWESFWRLQKYPKPDESCIDLGSSPGGWTWVLAQHSRQVTSVDKAALAPSLQNRKGLEYISADAFELDKKLIARHKWICSDIICYPPKLLKFVHELLALAPDSHFIFTIKFQGETDFATMDEFKKIPGSRLLHLYHNKHEVTWIRSPEADFFDSFAPPTPV